MLEEKETIITSLSDQLPYHTYTVKLGENNCSIILSPQILLDIAAYAEANRATLTQEAQEDAKQHQGTQSEDTIKLPQIMQEWRYKTSDLLDIAAYAEANRATLTQEAQEDAKYHHTGQLEDTTETPQNKQEWRYRTSDLLL